MSNGGDERPDSWIDDIPPEVVVMFPVLLLLWAVTPSDGLWILSQTHLIFAGLVLVGGLGVVVYFSAEAALQRTAGFIVLIGHGKRTNLAQWKKDPFRPPVKDVCVDWMATRQRQIRTTTNAAWTRTRRLISESDLSIIKQQSEEPSTQGTESNEAAADD